MGQPQRPRPACRRRPRRLSAALVVLGAVLGSGGGGVARAAEPAEPPPLVIAHRGASAEAPEHTFAAYDRAIEQHADVLECDLQLTKDEVLVCVHDTTVDRTTGGTATGRVDSFTLEELREMDFGSWFGAEFAGARIVPFEEQLRCYRDAAPGVQFYAETKAPAEYGGRMEPLLVELLQRLDLVPEGTPDPRRAPVIIQSFERTSLEAVKQLAPSLPTAWLWVVPPADAPADGSVPSGIDVMAPNFGYVVNRPEVVGQVHGSGAEVHTWTVDDPAVMDQLLDSGVDGIFTNDPAALRERVDARTDAAPRRSVTLERGCADVAGTVTAATDDTATDGTNRSTTTRSQPEDEDASDGSASWLLPALLVLGIGIGGAAIWRYRRRPS